MSDVTQQVVQNSSTVATNPATDSTGASGGTPRSNNPHDRRFAKVRQHLFLFLGVLILFLTPDQRAIHFHRVFLNIELLSPIISLMRCSINQAAFCPMFRSRASWQLDIPFLCARQIYIAANHLLSLILLLSNNVPTVTLNFL